jgi:penicillin V acylase-like amidase (Ntn superfamily)
MKPKLLLNCLVLTLLLSGCALPAASPGPASTGLYAAPAAGPACTSFYLDNGGHLIHGANLEHGHVYKGLLYVNRRNVAKEGLDPATTGEIARWTSKYGSVTFNLVGYEFPWGGMNEAGLTFSTMSLRESRNPAPDGRPPLQEPFYAQYLLDNCSTVEEVMATDARIRILDPLSHFLFCDRTGECVTVEFLGGKTVYHTGDELPVKALTNSTYRDSVKAWRKGRLSDQSLVRFGIAADRAQGFDAAGTESAIDYAFDTLYMADGDRRGGPSAQWSIVFDAQHWQIHFRTKRTPQIRSLDFDRIDFSCDAPVLMLDIHEDLSGDISQDLDPYSHSRSVEHFVQFFREWGMDVSRARTEKLVDHLEGFSCAKAAPAARPSGPTKYAVQPVQAGNGSWGGWLLGVGVFIPAATAVWYVLRKRSRRWRVEAGE